MRSVVVYCVMREWEERERALMSEKDKQGERIIGIYSGKGGVLNKV